MTRVLAVIGIVALLLYFRIPQRMNWDELRGFKGADRVEDAAKPFVDGLKPGSGEKPLPGGGKDKNRDESWMKQGCQKGSITGDARLTKADYNRYLSSRDLNADDPLQNGAVKPFCLHQDGAKVFIPDWLIERRYRLKITLAGEDVVEQVSGGQGT